MGNESWRLNQVSLTLVRKLEMMRWHKNSKKKLLTDPLLGLVTRTCQCADYFLFISRAIKPEALRHNHHVKRHHHTTRKATTASSSPPKMVIPSVFTHFLFLALLSPTLVSLMTIKCPCLYMHVFPSHTRRSRCLATSLHHVPSV